MSRKSRRRMTMAVGATLAGAAIPLAAASSAWANTEITYDGIVLYDDFDFTHPFGSSDVGTLAESGTNNDWAIVSAPATETFATTGVLANDSATNDVGDVAYYQSAAAPTTVFGEQGASIVNGTNDFAGVFNGGNAAIDLAQIGAVGPVSTSSAIATNGGFAGVENDGQGPANLTVTNDYAFGNGTAPGFDATGHALASTPSVAIFTTATPSRLSPTTPASILEPRTLARASNWRQIASTTPPTRAAVPTSPVLPTSRT